MGEFTYNIYMAAAFERADEIRPYAEQLNAIDNVQVVSRWVWPEKRTYDPATDAANDIDDIENSYMMISFTGQGGRGGRHVEFGLGLVMCTKMVIIGPKEHIFHELSKVKFGAPVLHFDTWTQFMNWFLDEELGV